MLPVVLDSASPKPNARELALRRLSVREYSAFEMRRYLERKSVEASVAQEAVERLVAERLIDDTRYATIWVRQYVLRGKGPAYVQAKLLQKGVRMEKDAIARMMAELSGESDLEMARRVVLRKYPEYQTDKSQAARAYQALLRRGFSFEVARQAVFSKQPS